MNRILIVFILLLAGCASERTQSYPSTAKALYGGASNIEIIKNADEVTACVLTYTPPREENGHYVDRGSYSEGEYIVVPKNFADKLKTALIRDSTYGWDYVKACAPEYHTKVKFRKGTDIISVQFCFECYILTIDLNDKYTGSEDFEGTVFIDTMRALFPSDEALKPEQK